MWNTVLHTVLVLNNIAEAVGQELDMTGDLSYIFLHNIVDMPYLDPYYFHHRTMDEGK